MPQSSSTWDVIIVGSGPAGATLARELSRGGRRVLLLEAGRSVRPYSPLFDMLRSARIRHLGAGTTLVRGQTVGGTSLLYYATANEPPIDRFQALGIDLSEAWNRLCDLVPLAPLRDDLIGPMALAIRDSALKIGHDWQKLPKFIDQSRIATGRIAEVMKHKWLAADFCREACGQDAHGCELVTGVRASRILTGGGRVRGVEYKCKGSRQHIFAPVVVLSAGGLGSAPLLQPLLGEKLSSQFFCDPVIVVSSERVDLDSLEEPPMIYGCRLEEDGLLLADLKLPRALFIAGALQALRPARIFSHRRALSLMVKAADGLGGTLTRGVHKTFSRTDLETLAKGVGIAEEILAGAGAKNIFASRITSAHPGGAIAIGEQLDSNLETSIGGLFVCDASVLPAPWGLPPTTSLMCLALRLGRHLLGD